MRLYRRSKSGNWHLAFTAPDGRRVRQSTGTSKRKEAQEYADRLKAETWRVHQLGDRPRRSWQEAVIRFLKETYLKRTHEQDKLKFKWLHIHLGHLLLDQVSPDVIATVRQSILSGETPAGGCSAANVNRHLGLVRSVLRKAAGEWDWIDKVPTIRLLDESATARADVRWLTSDKAGRLLKRLEDAPHIRDMAEFTLATGMRETNVTRLTWDHVDLDRRIAWVGMAQSKSKKALSVPLSRTAVDVLKRWHHKHSERVFVFKGQPIRRANKRAWKAALQAEGLRPHEGYHPDNFRWHDLRHTWASWHVQAGTPLEVLQQLGGWSSLAMVMRYAHLAPGHVAKYAENAIDTKLAQAKES